MLMCGLYPSIRLQPLQNKGCARSLSNTVLLVFYRGSLTFPNPVPLTDLDIDITGRVEVDCDIHGYLQRCAGIGLETA